GHNPEQVAKAIAAAQTNAHKPSLIACKTKIGYGAPTKQGSASSHGSPLGDDEIAGARKNLGWSHAPFEIPAPVLAAWREVGQQSQKDRKNWQARLDQVTGEKRELFDRMQKGDAVKIEAPIIDAFKKKMSAEAPKIATRAASGKVLEVLVPALPELIGGSADLTGSNLPLVKEMGKGSKADYSGRYVDYDGRGHGQAPAMNGSGMD